MSKICYVCKQQIGTFGLKWPYKDYVTSTVPLPKGMSELDLTCDSCYHQAKNAHEKETKEAKIQINAFTQKLLVRTPEYKKKWNKNGIMQFKNERIAILQRAYGA